MKPITLAMVVLCAVSSMALAGTTLFSDGDFTNVLPTKDDFIAGDTTFGVLNQWHYNSPELEPMGPMVINPTGGNTGAWFQHRMWSDVRAMVGLAAPTTDSKWTISFDWIFNDPGAYTYQIKFAVNGLMDGDSVAIWAGGPMGGTNLALKQWADLGLASTWTNKSFDVDVPAGFDAIVLTWAFGSDAGTSLARGFDNVLVVDNTQAAPHPGDANLDGKVSVGDLGILAANYGATGLDLATSWGKGDFNADGNVSVGDLGILAANYGWGTAAVPEPATLSLLGLGVLGLIRRRR